MFGSRMTMEKLATFHAVSYVLLKDIGNTDDVLQKYPSLRDVTFNDDNAFIIDLLESLKEMAFEILNVSHYTKVFN